MPGKAVGNVSLFTKQAFSESVKGSWNDLEKVDRGTPGGLDSPTLAEQARTVNQHQPAKHQGTWGAGAALNHIWGFLWTGISWDRTAVSAVGQEMGFGSSRNHQKGSWSQGEPGAVQQGISHQCSHVWKKKVHRKNCRDQCPSNPVHDVSGTYEGTRFFYFFCWIQPDMWNNLSYFKWVVGWIKHKGN